MIRGVLAIIAVHLCLLAAWPAQAEVAAADKIKTVYLLNFAKFIRWPAAQAEQPLWLCASVEAPLGRYMQQSLEGKFVQGRVLKLRIDEPELVALDSSCDMLYLSRSVQPPPAGAVVTVGEGREFAVNGGVFGFVRVDDNVRFVVNLSAIDKSAIAVDARLMTVAHEVIKP